MSEQAEPDQIISPEWARTMRLVRQMQVIVVITSTLLHGVFLAKARPLQSANDRSRWCTVWSLVERGSFQIDEIRQRPGWDTIDMVRIDDHFYSTKPPLLTSVVAGITWCLQRVTGWTLLDHLQQMTFAVLLIVNLVPFSLSLMVLIALLEKISSEPWTRFFVLTVAAFGTLLTPFSMTLNNHTVAAESAMVALFAMQCLLDRQSKSIWPYLLCGFAAAWTSVNELPAASLAAFLFVIAFRRSVFKTLLGFLPAAAIPVIALIATNIIATGTWKPLYANYGTGQYRFIVDGVPSYWMNPQGVDKNIDSPLTYFLHSIIGHHGVFSLTPIALFALAGWALSFRKQNRSARPLLVIGFVTFAVVIGFYMTRTQNYNYGGVSCGLRWALWMTPLWLVAVVPVFDLICRSVAWRTVTMILFSVSAYSAWQPIDNPWRQPWLFQWMESRGWIDYSDKILELSKPLWTWFSSLPELNEGQSPWIEFKIEQPALAPRYLRLTGRKPTEKSPEDQMEIEVKETLSDGSSRVRILLIDQKAFSAGGSPAEFVRWANRNVTQEQQQSDLAFVRGLPRKVPYHLRSIRYLKTSLRTEALSCQLVAAHVAFSAKEAEAPLNYRCDAWLTEDVPFGVAQVEFHVSQPENSIVYFHERWTVHDCWPKIKPYQLP